MARQKSISIRLVALVVVAALAVFGCATLLPSAPAPQKTGLPASASAPTPSTPGEVEQQSAALLPDARQDLTAVGDLTRYTIQVDIDYNDPSFTGAAQIDTTNREPVPLDRLYFRLLPNGGKSYGGGGSLEVRRTTIDGQPVTTHLSLSDTVLEVTLAEPLGVGESARVNFEFSGVVPVDFGSVFGESGGYGIYNYVDGVLALSGWYPILAVYDEDGWNLDPISAIGDSVYSDSAFYSVDVTAADDLVLATTGVPVEAEGMRHYATGPVRDFFMVMSPDYKIASQEADGVRVNSYYLPGDEEGGERALEVAAGALQVYDARFGRYPYIELDVVEAPMRNALGVEYPGIVLVSSDIYGRPSSVIFDAAASHEVAHQWWYGVVGNDVFDAPWLDEALATYSSSVYFQDAQDEAAYQGYAGYWLESLQGLRATGRDDVVTRSLSYFEDQDNGGSYGAVVYDKGALFFKALREEIGDPAFFSGLQSYYQEHKYGLAHTEDLLEAFEFAAGRPLDDLYQEWLYSSQP